MFVVTHRFSVDGDQVSQHMEGHKAREQEDPFVAENVVTAEIIEIDPVRADERPGFLVP